MTPQKPSITAFFIILILLPILQCGDYKGKIVGKWTAVENNCDQKGNCKNKDDVTGVFEYTSDGKIIIDDKLKGDYRVSKNIVEIKFPGNEVEWICEIFYIKGNEMLAKYRAKLAAKKTGEGKEKTGADPGGDDTALGETDIIKYNRVK